MLPKGWTQYEDYGSRGILCPKHLATVDVVDKL